MSLQTNNWPDPLTKPTSALGELTDLPSVGVSEFLPVVDLCLTACCFPEGEHLPVACPCVVACLRGRISEVYIARG